MATTRQRIPKPPKLPEALSIGPITVSVARQDLVGDDLGSFDECRSHIALGTSLNREAERFTLMHELVHALVWYSGLKNDLTRRTEERLCDAFGLLLLDVLRRNPELLVFIQED